MQLIDVPNPQTTLSEETNRRTLSEVSLCSLSQGLIGRTYSCDAVGFIWRDSARNGTTCLRARFSRSVLEYRIKKRRSARYLSPEVEQSLDEKQPTSSAVLRDHKVSRSRPCRGSGAGPGQAAQDCNPPEDLPRFADSQPNLAQHASSIAFAYSSYRCPTQPRMEV
jgi:hypothetical protein